MKHRWLILCALALLAIVVVACSSAPTPTSVPPTKVLPTATPAPTVKPAQPIPATHAGRTECLVCHQTGANNSPRVPTVPDHTAPAGFKAELSLCTTCHQPAK